MTTPDLPPGLPPLPPVPHGYDHLVYRGVAARGLETYYWLDCRVKDWHKGGHVSCGCPETHYLEAVREPAKDQLPAAFRDAFAEHFPAFREQMKAIAGASGVEARVCDLERLNPPTARERHSLASVIEKSP